MEDLRDSLRRELDLDYDAAPPSELGFLQASYPDLLFEEVEGRVNQVVLAVASRTQPGCVAVQDARASGIEVEVDDELLFPTASDGSTGRRNATLEGALSELCKSMRAGSIHEVDNSDHDAMVSEVLAPGHTRAVLFCAPTFELASGS